MEWTWEGSLNKDEVGADGFLAVIGGSICLYVREWVYLYINLGGTAEVIAFVPILLGAGAFFNYRKLLGSSL